MRHLGVNEAADAIRGQFFSDRSMRGSPEDAHRLKFAKDVATALGADTSPESVQHIMILLREANIDLHTGQEYPKYAVREWDKTTKIVHDSGEEDAWVHEAKPEEPAPVAMREQAHPVQDLSIDLRNQVPQHVDHEHDPHPAGRVPSAVTNREAAQDAYARQPIDHDHVNTDSDVIDDDEVHVEDVADTGSKAEGGAPYAKPADVGVMAHDDADGDGVAGQDDNPTHDSVLGTEQPQSRSGDSSAGKTDTKARPVGNRNPTNKRP